jgi:hypothetical protein
MNELPLKENPEQVSANPEAKPNGAVAKANGENGITFAKLPGGTPLTLATAEGTEQLVRAAKFLAGSELVPKEYQNKPASCVIALDLANRIGAPPMMVMQNLYIVHGRPGWSAKFLIATFNKSGKFSAIRYEFVGAPNTDAYGCRAYATEKATGQTLHGPTVTIDIAKKEGWYDKKARDGSCCSKWPTMPEQMLRYRAAAWFINTIAPEIAMGLPTADEVEDSIDAEVIDAQASYSYGQPASRAAQVKASLQGEGE